VDLPIEIRGQTHGDYACKFPGYCYKKPVPRELTIQSLHPERVSPYREWPQWKVPIRPTGLDYIELLDYSINIGAPDDAGVCDIQVWLLPNVYTIEAYPVIVYSFRVASAVAGLREVQDEALRRAFSG